MGRTATGASTTRSTAIAPSVAPGIRTVHAEDANVNARVTPAVYAVAALRAGPTGRSVAVWPRGTSRRLVASGTTNLKTDRSSEWMPVDATWIGPRSNVNTGFRSLPA